MPTFSNSTDTTQPYIPALNDAAIPKLTRVSQFANDMTEWASMLAAERSNIAAGLPVWRNGVEIRIMSWSGGTARWSQAAVGAGQAGNALTVVLTGGKTIAMLGDTNTVTATTGAPSGGAAGDVKVDLATGLYYVNTAGMWGAPLSLFAGLSSNSASASRVYGGVSKWLAAKRRGASLPARFAFSGDSNVMGQGSNSGTTGTNGAQLTCMARLLANSLNLNIDSMFGDQNIISASNTLNVYDTRVTLGSGWASESAVSAIPGGRAVVGSAGASGAFAFAPNGNFDMVKIWYPSRSDSATALVVLIDGTVVDTINATTATANSLQSKTYTTTLGTHTVSFTTGATGTARISGIECRNSTINQPMMMQCGWSAATIANLAYAAVAYAAQPALVAMAPDFSIGYCTINDTSAATSLSTYYSLYEGWVSAQAGSTDGLLCVGYPGVAVGTNNGYLDQVAIMLRNLAMDYGWGFFDARTVFGNSNVRAGAKGLGFDGSHPNGAGHTAFAAAVYSHLVTSGINLS